MALNRFPPSEELYQGVVQGMRQGVREMGRDESREEVVPAELRDIDAVFDLSFPAFFRDGLQNLFMVGDDVNGPHRARRRVETAHT